MTLIKIYSEQYIQLLQTPVIQYFYKVCKKILQLKKFLV